VFGRLFAPLRVTRRELFVSKMLLTITNPINEWGEGSLLRGYNLPCIAAQFQPGDLVGREPYVQSYYIVRKLGPVSTPHQGKDIQRLAQDIGQRHLG
jgi:hypothetical protein